MEPNDNSKEAFRQYQKELPYMTAADFDTLGNAMKALAINFAKIERKKRRLVAEVVELTGACAAHYKKGDRLVFNVVGIFLPHESTTKLACSWLLQNLVVDFAVNEGLMAHNIELKEPYGDIRECPDPGPPTGWGHVRVKLSIV